LTSTSTTLNLRAAMPLTYDEALSAAKAFLEANPFPYPEYRYPPPSAGQPIAEGWYFDFHLERVDAEPMQFPRDAFGAAPGYKVLAATGEVRVVGWEEYHQLNTTAEEEDLAARAKVIERARRKAREKKR
jgi:hypothetical protein